MATKKKKASKRGKAKRLKAKPVAKLSKVAKLALENKRLKAKLAKLIGLAKRAKANKSVRRRVRGVTDSKRSPTSAKRKPVARGARPIARHRTDYLRAIERSLTHVAKRARAEGWESYYSAVRNADRSVDGEVRILLQPGLTVADALIDKAEDWTIVPQGCWISGGVRFEATDALLAKVKDPERDYYQMVQGQINVGTYGRRAQQKGSVFRALHDPEKGIAHTMGVIARRKPTEVYIRLRYSPDDRKPTRIGRKIPKRRKRKT